ncbi:lipase family protein [Rhodococcus sp. NPDC004095]
MGIARRVGVVVAALLLGTGTLASATADPITDLIHPPHDPALVAPTPLDDPWYDPPPGFESAPPGTVLAARPVTVRPLVTLVSSTEVLVRSTDSKGRPVPVVTTVIVPAAPWTGPGPRPVVDYNMAIDSLGNTCAPSYQMPRGQALEVVGVQYFLARNYAVVVPDHQGPRQAYAAGRMAGHAVLDAVRAAVSTPAFGLTPDAPVAMTGYSGGAIATGWAAELAPTYAPELRVVGAALGGTPADYNLLLGSLDGRNLASGVLLGATLGVAREYPELYPLFNDNAWRLGSLARDLCLFGFAVPGALVPIRAQHLSDVPDVVHNPVAQAVIADNRLGAQAPAAPILLYHGRHEFWITRQNAEHLYAEWCAGGADVRLAEYPGEHLIVAIAGIPEAYHWIDARLAGVPVEPGCSSVVR